MIKFIQYKPINSLFFLLIFLFFINSCKLFCPEEEEKPQMQRIAFLRDRDPDNDLNSNNDIWIMDMDGSNQSQLTFSVDIVYFLFSPNGEKICFLGPEDRSDITKWINDLYIMNSNGSELKKLTNSDSYITRPIFTTEGDYLIFNEEQNVNELGDVFMTDIMRAQKTNITKTDSIMEFVYDIKPDGSQILIKSFPLDQVWNANLYFIDLDGSNRTCVTCNIVEPAPSMIKMTPDGEKIVYRQMTRAIDIIDIDGTNHQNLIQHSSTSGIYIDDIFISPESDYLLYQDGNNADIYKLNIDGSNNTNLTTNSWGWNPDISNDGQFIIFTSAESDISNNIDIYIMNQFGVNKTRLTHSGGNYPKFQPQSY